MGGTNSINSARMRAFVIALLVIVAIAAPLSKHVSASHHDDLKKVSTHKKADLHKSIASTHKPVHSLKVKEAAHTETKHTPVHKVEAKKPESKATMSYANVHSSLKSTKQAKDHKLEEHATLKPVVHHATATTVKAPAAKVHNPVAKHETPKAKAKTVAHTKHEEVEEDKVESLYDETNIPTLKAESKTKVQKNVAHKAVAKHETAAPKAESEDAKLEEDQDFLTKAYNMIVGDDAEEADGGEADASDDKGFDVIESVKNLIGFGKDDSEKESEVAATKVADEAEEDAEVADGSSKPAQVVDEEGHEEEEEDKSGWF
eukprot:c5131_g1_i1.p1 GENE.c5131_g1_i1~~c5131_g1_i1.p1  ORF type:complete len:317 (+),score=88.94 c5131_g1_i1:1-951(+)